MKIKDLILAALFAAITVVLSILLIPLPFTPVPITLQVLAVAVSGAILGKRLGAISQIIYMLLGMIGLPVYSGGNAGIGVLLGPTGGYIFGFIGAAFVIGLLVEMGTRYIKTPIGQYGIILVSMIVGVLVIYIFGVIQLSIIAHLSIGKAIIGGAAPFIIPDIIKVGIGSVVAYFVRQGLRKANLLPVAKPMNV